MTNEQIKRVEDLPLQDDRTVGWTALRETGEIVDLDGTYALVSAAQVEYATKHPEIFSSAKAFEALGSPLPLIPIASDPPDHARYRRMLDRYFSPQRMAEREPELRAQVAELIEAIRIDGPQCDVVAALANPFPTQVFLILFGLPLEDRDRLIGWKNAVIEAVDPTGSLRPMRPLATPLPCTRTYKST